MKTTTQWHLGLTGPAASYGGRAAMPNKTPAASARAAAASAGARQLSQAGVGRSHNAFGPPGAAAASPHAVTSGEEGAAAAQPGHP